MIATLTATTIKKQRAELHTTHENISNYIKSEAFTALNAQFKQI